MNYSKVNNALAEEFGEGQVEVREAPKAEWDYTLWFLNDNPSKIVIKKAQKIVDRFEPTLWMDDKSFRS